MTITEKSVALVHILQSAPPASVFRRRPPGYQAEDVPPGGWAPFPMELMLARIEGCTKLLAQAGLESTPAAIDQAVEQVLLADAALVTGYLRCQTDDLSTRLNEGLSDLRVLLAELDERLQFAAPECADPPARGDEGTVAAHHNPRALNDDRARGRLEGRTDILTELGIKYATDKAFHHAFTEDYHRAFKAVRFDVKSVLEIGVCKGRSIKMWLDYFPNAIISCIDIMDVASFVAGSERVRFHQCSQSEYKTDQIFDIIIDDGSHLMKDQQDTFTNLLQNWRWFYVIEDLHTSNTGDYGCDGTNSTIDFLREFQRNNESGFNLDIISKREDSITSIITRNR